MQTHSRRAVLAGLAASLACSRPGVAQDQTLRIVFSFSAGGASDGIARLIADRLRTSLGRPVIVENIVGAGGRLGARAAKAGPPNGSRLLFASNSQMTLQPHIYHDLGYDPFDDFVPVSQTVKSEVAFAVGGRSPIRSIEEAIAWLKANPADALYGSPGVGTGPHVVGLELARIAGLDLRHVPYKGTPAALPDLIAGRIPLYAALTAEFVEQHKSGTIRVLATADAARSPILPDVPTLREGGLAIDAPGWFGFFAPAGTPPDVVALIEKAIIAATNAPDARARILALGYQPTGTTGVTLGRIQREDFERWGTIVKTSGFRA
jgi:tripartite-type tricarboxylate transporter receptor subunit TctC